jgi:hypothetical protein
MAWSMDTGCTLEGSEDLRACKSGDEPVRTQCERDSLSRRRLWLSLQRGIAGSTVATMEASSASNAFKPISS